jgi:SAM-dependent methyltransferase
VLDCDSCRLWYPVTCGIPRLLVAGPLRPPDLPFLERWPSRRGSRVAASDPAGSRGDAQAQVQTAFGHKWTHQPWWGLEGESAGLMEEWLLPRYGWADRAEYERFIGGRRRILDAGSGLGREAVRMAQANPSAEVYGLELSGCVDLAAAHAGRRGLTNVRFVQADLMRPPFAPGSFDFVFCEGVIHHTPDTRAALRSLVRLLARGGEIAFYVYRKKAPLREFADDFVRSRLQELSPEEAWALMAPLTRLGQALAGLKAELDVPEDVEVLGIKAGRYDVQRLVHYAMFKCFWNDRLSFDENVHVNFDWYYPRHAWRHTEEEVRAWLAEAGLTAVHESVEPSGITIRASLRGEPPAPPAA